MKPLSSLAESEARSITGLVFDLDDTVLDHGALTEPSYSALFRLREAGLRLIACTGRPAGWADVVVRQWPIDAAIAENGAIAFVRERTADRGSRIVRIDPAAGPERARRRAELSALAGEILARFPGAALADDNDARITDVTLDVGEHRHLSEEDVATMRAMVQARGVRTFVSSIHMHLTRERDDKASGTIRLLCEHFGEDATRARAANAYVGDSANDATAFAAFALTFGVANVRAHLTHITVPPRFVAASSRGAGFAEISNYIAELRR